MSHFDDIAEFFDRVTGTALHRRLRCAAVAALRPLQGRRVLDLGTGPGGLAADLAKQGASVVGLDGSPEMMERAQARLVDQQLTASVELVHGDAGKLPFDDGSFDDVAGMLVLHLVDDPVRVLAECRRVARPGARLAFVTQSDDFGPEAAAVVRGPLGQLELEFLEGCAGSAASHPRLDRAGWETAFAAAGLPAPTVTPAVPGVAWLLFSRR